MTTYQDIDLQDLVVSENNVRSLAVEDMAGADFQELMSSVKEHGILESLIVTREGEQWKVIGGRRRLLALKELYGKKSYNVPCAVVEGKEAVDQWTISANENKHRKSLSSAEWKDTIETGKKMGLNQSAIAKRLGVSRSTVSSMASGKSWTEINSKRTSVSHAEPKAQEPKEFGVIDCPACGVHLKPVVDGNTLRLDIQDQVLSWSGNTDKPSRRGKK